MDNNGFDNSDAFALLGLLALMSGHNTQFPNEQLPCVFDPRIQQAKQEDIDRLKMRNANESVAYKGLDRLDALVTPACTQYDKLKNDPGKKFDDGEVFIDHTSIMLALGRAKHNDDTGVIEPTDDDDRDLFSGVGGDIYD